MFRCLAIVFGCDIFLSAGIASVECSKSLPFIHALCFITVWPNSSGFLCKGRRTQIPDP